MSTQFFSIPRSNFLQVHETIDKLNKLAKKLNISEIQVSNVEHTEERRQIDGERVIVIPKVNFLLTFEEIKIGDYEFIGSIDHDQDIGNIVKSVPGKTIPEIYFNANSDCDHCHVHRFRTETFIFKDESGYKQVGRTCLKLFFGIDPSKVLGWFDRLHDLIKSTEEGCGDHFNPEDIKYPINETLSVMLVLSKRFGYTSKKIAFEQDKVSTVEYTNSVYFPDKNSRESIEFSRSIFAESVKYNDKANEMIEWGKEYFKDAKTEYNHNMLNILSQESVTCKVWAFLASLIPVYNKVMDETKEKVHSNNEFIGKVGDKIEVNVTVNKIIVTSGYYGETYIVLMTEDNNGNHLVWFATNTDLEENQHVKLKGIVKSHTTRETKNQTVLTRCKVIG